MVYVGRAHKSSINPAGSNTAQTNRRGSHPFSSQAKVTTPLSPFQRTSSGSASGEAIGAEDKKRLNKPLSEPCTEGGSSHQYDVQGNPALFFPSHKVAALRSIKEDPTDKAVLVEYENTHFKQKLDVPPAYSGEAPHDYFCRDLSDASSDCFSKAFSDRSSDESEYIEERQPLASVVQQKRTAEPETSNNSKRVRTTEIYSNTSIEGLPDAALSGLDSAKLKEIGREIYSTFPAQLMALLGHDSRLSSTQRARMRWKLPEETLFMAAVLHCASQACEKLKVKVVTPDIIDAVLPKALQTVCALKKEGDSDIAKWLSNIDDIHLQTLMAAPDKFQPKAHETAEVSAQIAQGIKIRTGHEIAADQIWRLCIDPQTIALLEERGVKADNPFLPYVFDNQANYLKGALYALLCVLKRIENGLAPDVDFFIEVNRACVGRADHDGSMDLETGDVEFGMLKGSTFSQDGMEQLLARANELEAFNIKVEVNNSGENIAYSAQFGQPFVTYKREFATQIDLKKALQHGFDRYEEERNKPLANPILAVLRLAGYLNGIHAFPDGNIRTCHFLVLYDAIVRGQSPFMLGDPNKFDGYADHELLEMNRHEAIHFTTDGRIVPMSSVEEAAEIAQEAVQIDALMARPRRNERITGDFPWPLTTRLISRLRIPRSALAQQISDLAASLGGERKGLHAFARLVVNNRGEFTALTTEQPGELRRYTASLPGRNGSRVPAPVALLAYVEDGYITEIRTDTQINRKEIGIEFWNSVQVKVRRGNIYHMHRSVKGALIETKPRTKWVQSLHSAFRTDGDPKQLISIIEKAVNPQVKGYNDKINPLPEGALLYDYQSENNPNKVTLLVTVEDRGEGKEITMLRQDSKEARDWVKNNKNLAQRQAAAAVGDKYLMSRNLSSYLNFAQDKIDWVQDLRTALENAGYKFKTLSHFARDEMVKPGAGYDDQVNPQPEGMLLYDYPSKDDPNKVTLLVKVEDQEEGKKITMLRQDNTKARKEIAANRRLEQRRAEVEAGKAYGMDRQIQCRVSQKTSSTGWIKNLWSMAENSGYEDTLKPYEDVSVIGFLRDEVVKPGLGLKDDKNPLPDGVLIYHYPPLSDKPKVKLLAYVIDNKIHMARQDTPTERKEIEKRVEKQMVKEQVAAQLLAKQSKKPRNPGSLGVKDAGIQKRGTAKRR